MTPEIIEGRAAILAARYTPYLAYSLRDDEHARAYVADGAVLAIAQDVHEADPEGQALGDPVVCRALYEYAIAEGALRPGCWTSSPHGTGLALAGKVHEWDFKWTTAPPKLRAGEELVEVTTDADGINEVLDLALPESTARPGSAHVRAWYGIRAAGGELVAVAADVSRNGFGTISGIGVRPSAQGRGLGAAITAALTRMHLEEFGFASLGVYTVNAPAIAMYERLGYSPGDSRVSGKLA
ncbi:GNAT family N-acetyltransferase [Longispora albida]|uniref:GNAT family N-acetyltransferase n=1 Tax=Longispora albida TaxID=203523 RepID=UPI0012F726F9|nr:GNAT family N-acetyltransferase [Longispora albida]